MQEGAHQSDAAPMNLERFLHYWREGEVDKVRGWRRRCLWTRVFFFWNIVVGEKNEASCLFPSLTHWNPEAGGKNPPKRWFERKGGKKESNKNPINYTLFGYVLIFLVLHDPWAAFHYFQLITLHYSRKKNIRIERNINNWIIN